MVRRCLSKMWLGRRRGFHSYLQVAFVLRMSQFKRFLVLLTSITSFVVIYIIVNSELTQMPNGRILSTLRKHTPPRREKDKTETELNFRSAPLRKHDGKPIAQMPHNLRETTTVFRHLKEAEVASRFEARRRLFESACERLGRPIKSRKLKKQSLDLPAKGSSIIRVTYCPIPKISSSTWKHLFKSMKVELRKESRNNLDFVEAKENRTDVSFVFVREPYGRLLSAYVDKIFTPNALFSRIAGVYTVQNFRLNASPESLRCGYDVTFPEFIKFFIHIQNTGTKRDPHFVPAHQQCQMCKQRYDYIGHLETLREDMPFILKAINSPVSYNKTFDNVTLVRNSHMTLERMRKRIRDCMELDQAARRLWKKWQIRGILSKTQSFPLTREQTKNISADQFAAVALSALGRSGPKSSRVGQKREALREAFSTVPLEDKLEVKKLLSLEFELFGFDPELEEVFPSKHYTKDPHFSYFDLYQ